VQRVQEWVGIHHEDTTLSPADKDHWNTAQVVELVLENHQDTKIYPLHWSDL
jgi:hypothetical protein